MATHDINQYYSVADLTADIKNRRFGVLDTLKFIKLKGDRFTIAIDCPKVVMLIVVSVRSYEYGGEYYMLRADVYEELYYFVELFDQARYESIE